MALHVRRALAASLAALSLLVSAETFAQQVIQPKDAPSESDIGQAKERMGAGVALMTDPDGARYEEAYPQFREAYRLSGSLNALQNLAICAMKLELDGEAIAYFKTVLEKKGDDLSEQDRDQIQKDITRLEATLAWITLSAAPGTKVADERVPRQGAPVRNKYEVGDQPLKVGVRPGSHTFVATDPAGRTSTWKIDVANRSTHEHTFVFEEGAEPPPVEGDEGEGGIPIPVWIAGGATVAAGIAFGVLAGVASAKKSSYVDDVYEAAPLDEQQSAYDEVTTLNLVADVMLGVTVAGAATTVVLALVLPSGDEETGSAAAPRFGRDYVVAPSVSPRGGGLSLSARF